MIAGTLGHAPARWNFVTWKAGPLSRAAAAASESRIGIAIAMSCWKFAMVTTARAPFFAAYSSGVRKSVQFFAERILARAASSAAPAGGLLRRQLGRQPATTMILPLTSRPWIRVRCSFC